MHVKRNQMRWQRVINATQFYQLKRDNMQKNVLKTHLNAKKLLAFESVALKLVQNALWV